MAHAMRFDFFRSGAPAAPAPLPDLPDDFPFFEGGARAPGEGEGEGYIADEALADAVNTAICVGQPLLVTGEAGCGKTTLAGAVAHKLGLGPPLRFFTRSTSRAQDLLYTFDAVRRFHDIQARQDERARDPMSYIQWGPLGRAIVEDAKRVVLIDEIDKAPRDFPNDLLRELDKMEFEVPELDGEARHKRAKRRPIVIITSNVERQLPAPFLRRCVFHEIAFPDGDRLKEIVELHLRRRPGLALDRALLDAAVSTFEELRRLKGWVKKPGTGELLSWVYALVVKGVGADEVRRAPPNRLPLRFALIKDSDDHKRLPDSRGRPEST